MSLLDAVKDYLAMLHDGNYSGRDLDGARTRLASEAAAFELGPDGVPEDEKPKKKTKKKPTVEAEASDDSAAATEGDSE